MATVTIAASQAGANQGSRTPTLSGAPRASQVVTSSASNAVSTVIANAGEVLAVCVSGGAIRVAFASGANPNAATGAQYLVPDGGLLPVQALTDDFRVAVANV